MANGDDSKLKHLHIKSTPLKDDYRSPRTGRSKELRLASRNRDDHGKKLKEQLKEIQNQKKGIDDLRKDFGYRGDYGVYIEFSSEENFDLKVESLERLKSGIELQNIREDNNVTYATVYVPEGKIKNFFNIIDKYLTQNVKYKPKNKEFVESIAEIKLATLKAFWTDFENFDDISQDEIRWWELWLRNGLNAEEKEVILLAEFSKFIQQYEVPISQSKINLSGTNHCYLVKASKLQLSSSIISIDELSWQRLNYPMIRQTNIYANG
jgi:hypothetical protein